LLASDSGTNVKDPTTSAIPKKPITSIALDEICEIHKDFEPFVDNV